LPLVSNHPRTLFSLYSILVLKRGQDEAHRKGMPLPQASAAAPCRTHLHTLIILVVVAAGTPGLAQPFIGRDDAGNLIVNTARDATLLLNGQAVPTCNCTALQVEASSVSAQACGLGFLVELQLHTPRLLPAFLFLSFAMR
jgi:hypothetical protein